MLDLFRVADGVENYEELDQDCFLGSISLVQHRALQKVFQSPGASDIPFFDDTRLNSQQVASMYQICVRIRKELMNQTGAKNHTYLGFENMLKTAVDNQQGILVICD